MKQFKERHVGFHHRLGGWAMQFVLDTQKYKTPAESCSFYELIKILKTLIQGIIKKTKVFKFCFRDEFESFSS